ncbi:hypothetical protein DY000_02062813 [Brassica cretica]|uniref:Zinc knuckle CX2CX4HX4C domain-containing protein n=1 Tax=Brassica cretica TaxID=69181 RepID=A0ABQ7B1X9_BRACR|nr:hypothetical protein DY000_02062813 [Brassica cretica]
MHLEISLAGEVKKVELEYEKLEKHCFTCHNLSHENGDCPSHLSSRDLRSNSGTISQTRTLDHLEDSRRRRDERIGGRDPRNFHNERDRWNNNRREPPKGGPRSLEATPQTYSVSHRPSPAASAYRDSGRRSSDSRPPGTHLSEQLLQRGASILESGRLQDVEIQYLEDNLPSGANEVNSVPSSSRGPIQNRLSLPQLSPIRSLSEDRRHVFERLGDTINLVGNADEDGEIPVEVNPVAPPLQVDRSTAGSRAASKAAGKRIATEQATTTKKRAPPAPPTGVSVKRRCPPFHHNHPGDH